MQYSDTLCWHVSRFYSVRTIANEALKRSMPVRLLLFKAALDAGSVYQVADLGSLGGVLAAGYGVSASGLIDSAGLD
jgi:hypothetical protein